MPSTDDLAMRQQHASVGPLPLAVMGKAHQRGGDVGREYWGQSRGSVVHLTGGGT